MHSHTNFRNSTIANINESSFTYKVIADIHLKPKLQIKINSKLQDAQNMYKQQHNRRGANRKEIDFKPKQNIVVQKNNERLRAQIINETEYPRLYIVKD